MFSFDLSQAKKRVKDLSDYLQVINFKTDKELRNAIDNFRNELGTYKDKGWKYIDIRHEHVHSYYKEYISYIVEGTTSEYTDNHPMSPDGCAMAEISFIIVCQNDDIWNKRIYISFGNE